MRTPIYKQIKIMVEHCPVCKEQLRGNNSISRPWQCACGTWVTQWGRPGEYEVTKLDKE